MDQLIVNSRPREKGATEVAALPLRPMPANQHRSSGTTRLVLTAGAVALLVLPGTLGVLKIHPNSTAEPSNHLFLWLFLSLELAAVISIMVYLVATRRRGTELVALTDELSHEAEEHRRSDQRYRLLVENAPDSIVTLDRDGCFTSINPRSEEIIGWSRDAWLHRLFVSLVHPEDVTRAKLAIETAVSGSKPPLVEIRMLNKSGAPVPMEYTIAPDIHDGAVQGVLAIGRDISARRKAEQTQNALEMQLRRAQKMEALGRLAGGIAHDFNNFLTVIITNCQLARAATAADHPAARGLQEIDQTSHHAAEMVRQILAFSRNQKQERRALDLEPVVQEAVKLLRSMLPVRILIESRLSPNCPAILGNAEQIHQILLNLGANAAHAMRDRGGRLEISLMPLRVDETLAVRNPDLRAGPYLNLSVSDNGHGMDAQTIERIFDPFFTTKPAGEGTGLGLAIVHGIMKNHDGAVTVYSEPKRGTMFNLYFPACAGVELPSDSPPTPPARGHGQHILFVDDEPALTEIGRRFLESLGYRATVSNSPSDALRMLQGSEPFDCIFSDLAMPDINGLEFAGECQKLKPGIPFILASGYHSGLTIESLHECGVSDFILKPFNLNVVADALNRVLPTNQRD